MLITSVDNKKIKEIVKLKQKKYRDLENKFIIETKNLLKEAASMNALEEVYLLEGENLGFAVNCPIYFLTENVVIVFTLSFASFIKFFSSSSLTILNN